MVEKKYKNINRLLIDLEESVHYKVNNSSVLFKSRSKKECISKQDKILLKKIRNEIVLLNENKLLRIKKEHFPNIFVLRFRYIYIYTVCNSIFFVFIQII
jgi:hypothetical protein